MRGGSFSVAVAVVAVLLQMQVAVAFSPAVPAPEMLRVEVTALVDPAVVVARLERLGAVIELRSRNRVQVLLPADRLPELQRARALLRVERPALPIPLEVLTATELIGADRWRAAGFTGHGVRVAVLDAGFAGYEQQLGTTLPARVEVRSFRANSDIEAGTDHGLQAAEVVHRVAPGAALYLVNFGTVTELSAAVDYIIEKQIDVVSFSLGFIHNGPGDGTGPVDDIIGRGAEGNSSWVVAAGNWARQHWSGAFVDSDGDSIHEFASGVQQNSRPFQAGDLIIVSLRWDDEWGAACSDYDLELFGPDGSLVRASRQIQDCTGDPVEGLQVLATQDGEYGVRIVRASPGDPRNLDLMVVGSPGRGESLTEFVEEGSLSEPADNAAVITVGAVTSIEPLQVEPFSSRGPTADGRAKPEVVSPTGLLDALEGGEAFAGTSAAAPHVAGVVALLLEAFPGADSTTVRAELTRRAVDLPPEGVDAASGSGVTNLGSLAGLGLLLPVGADEARMHGSLPPSDGLALLAYTGPDGYPLRFARLLTEGREPLAWFRLVLDKESGEQRWERHIVGAPPRINDFVLLEDGQPLVARFSAPAGSTEPPPAEEP